MFGKKKTTEKKTSSTRNSSKKPAAKKPATKTTKSVSKTQTQELAEYIRQKQPADPEFQYIANEAHYDKVIEKIKDCKKLSGYACAQAQTSITSYHVNERSSYGSPLQRLQAEGVLWGPDSLIFPQILFFHGIINRNLTKENTP